MTRTAPLQHLSPVWFSVPMGLSGLSLAWLRAATLMGESATGIALVLGGLALLSWLALAVAGFVRLQRHPKAWEEDRRHPVRHAFFATIPIGLLLLATVGAALLGPEGLAAGGGLPAVVNLAWWLGALGQFATTLWLLSRWWAGNQPGGLQWPVLTPALIVPVVGNVIAPLAGVALGHGEWAAAQFGVGLLFWPVILVLLLVRVATQGLWPERLLPAHFIFVAPPAVIGLALSQFGVPLPIVWGCWGIALFSFLWAGSQARRLGALPFGIGHWGLSFPLAAFAGLTLRLAEPGGLLAVLGPLLLALASLIVTALLLATWRGLRQGTLLVPEQVAVLQPVGSPAKP